jgi:hypothetical protein
MDQASLDQRRYVSISGYVLLWVDPSPGVARRDAGNTCPAELPGDVMVCLKCHECTTDTHLGPSPMRVQCRSHPYSACV